MAYSSTTQDFMSGPARRPRRRHTRTRQHDIFPDLEPEAPPSRSEILRTRAEQALATLREQFSDAVENPASRNPLARLIVWTMNLVLLIVAFPIGFAMLLLNILGGENLRATAQVMALTGLALALSSAGDGLFLLGLG